MATKQNEGHVKNFKNQVNRTQMTGINSSLTYTGLVKIRGGLSNCSKKQSMSTVIPQLDFRL